MMTVGQALAALLACPLWIAGTGVAVVVLVLVGCAVLAIRWSEEGW